MKYVPAILEQHAEESAFLWILRDGAIHAPHYSLADLAKLDSRVDAHLDGLRIAGPYGWGILKHSLSLEGPGEIFAAAVIAFESGDAKRTDLVLEAGTANLELSRGLVSAIGWLPPKKADRLIKMLLASPSTAIRRIGVAGAAIRRLDFEKGFLEAVRDKDPLLQARALVAIAQLGMARHAALFSTFLNAVDPAVGYAAAWGGTLTSGDPSALSALQAFAAVPGRKAREALVLAVRRLTPAAAMVWSRKLAARPETLRQAVIAAGAAGDPAAVPWLLDQTTIPPIARVAGEALSMITGVDLAYQDLDAKKPEGFEAGPNDDPKDDNVAPDPDEDLPWPHPPRLRVWWDAQKSRYAAGRRYLVGKEISAASVREILKTGRQRQRAAAALELAILQPGTPLAEARAPGFRQ
ncbi:MAG TPA: TIGR02270 family protein [Planctomycetota bacterium]|nr:TIGR02270 family protein [Planctomycetota bacterium]